MKLMEVISAYVVLKQSLGIKFEATGRLLRQFGRSTGMRIGEALGLTLRDVDLVQRIITVRNTKFYKTRLVPIGPKLAQELAGHIERRRQLPTPVDENSAVFTTRTGRPWPYQHVITLLHITPELLHEASHRFADYALQGDGHD